MSPRFDFITGSDVEFLRHHADQLASLAYQGTLHHEVNCERVIRRLLQCANVLAATDEGTRLRPAFTTGLPRCEPICDEASLEAYGSDGFLHDIGARICPKCRAVWPKADPEYPWPQCDACNGSGPCSLCGRT